MSGFFVLFSFYSFGTSAFYYSNAIENNKKEYSFERLLSDFTLVVLISKDCPACKQLHSTLDKCNLPIDFKIAWVGSELAGYKFQTTATSKILTREKTIQTLTSVTPKSFLNGTDFKVGTFDCKELESAINTKN